MEEWHYHPADDLDDTFVQRLKRFPREPDLLTYAVRSLAAIILRGALRLCHRFEVIGRENLPKEGSFVLVANHSSHLDALCLASAMPLRMLHHTFPAAAADYFFVSWPRLAAAVLLVNALPFHRQLHVRHSVALCRKLLENPGNVLIIFPEGTRCTTGQIGPFRGGIGLLLAGTSIPVVPCYVEGAHAAWPKGKWLPRPRRVRLHIGTPRTYDHLTGKEAARMVCEDLRSTVGNLSKPS